MQGSPETAIYINNGNWNSRQVREASYDLCYYSKRVLEEFIHSLQEVYEAFDVGKIPSEKKVNWDNSERWVLRFFSNLSFRNTSRELDNKIIRARNAVEAFVSVQDVLNYWGEGLKQMDRRLTILNEGNGATLKIADSSYVDSRVLRFAAHGIHLVHPEAFTLVEN